MLNFQSRFKMNILRWSSLIAIGLVLHSNSLSQSLSFRSPLHLPVGKNPNRVELADVNKDGNLDIIVTNYESDNITVYLGDGKGGFKESKGSPFASGKNPNDLAFGDFNRDGNPDIAIANHSIKLVTILLGNGKGRFSFASGSPFAVPSNPHPHGIVAADFNGDNKLDLAVDSWGENKVLVLFGNGDGTFQTPGIKFDVGVQPYQRLRSGDVNEDGNADIITSNFDGRSVSILLGNGKGEFAERHMIVPDCPFGIALADFNGDHHLDIAISHYSGQGTDPSKNGLSILFGDGKGNFSILKGSPFPVGNYPPTVVAGDMNGDGIADMAVPAFSDNVVSIYFGGKKEIKQAQGSPIHVGHGPECVAIGDLNRDGKPDLVVTDEEDNEIEILFQK
jgi:hypothetical protein